MSLFIGESHESDPADLVIEAQMDRYMGTWEMENERPKRKRDDISSFTLTEAEFWHGIDSEIFWEVLTD